MLRPNLTLLRWKSKLRALLFKDPMESASEKDRWPEFGVEFLLELGLALYQLGAEQMDLPHNFTLGLLCWFAAIGIGLRMFWILPWLKSWSRLLKAVICFAVMANFIALEYRPVLNAYKRTKDSPALLPVELSLGCSITDLPIIVHPDSPIEIMLLNPL